MRVEILFWSCYFFWVKDYNYLGSVQFFVYEVLSGYKLYMQFKGLVYNDFG